MRDELQTEASPLRHARNRLSRGKLLDSDFIDQAEQDFLLDLSSNKGDLSYSEPRVSRDLHLAQFGGVEFTLDVIQP